MEKIIVLLKLLANKQELSQRQIANETNFSLGMVNHLLRQMIERDLLCIQEGQKGYLLTKKGRQFLNNTLYEQSLEKVNLGLAKWEVVNTAIILAAGMNPQFSGPIGLEWLEKDVCVIDRTITMLREEGISNIIMVIGYEKQKFIDRYKDKGILFVENDHYRWSGTMYSLSLAYPFINGDVLIIESDHVFERRFLKAAIEYPNENCLMLKGIEGGGADAFVEFDEKGNLYRISKDLHQLNRIDGSVSGLNKISYAMFTKMMEMFTHNSNPYLNYEYAIENMARSFRVPTKYVDDAYCIDLNNQSQYHKLCQVFYPKIKEREDFQNKQEKMEVFSQIMQIDISEITNLTFAGGMTNRNYKVDTKNNGSYILRIPGKCTEQMISRQNEKYNSKIGYLLNLNVDTVYFNEVSGIKITRYVDHVETLNGESAQMEYNMKQTTSLLRTLHTSEVELKSYFDVSKEIEKYENIICQHKGKYYLDYDIGKEIFSYMKQEMDRLGWEFCPCHNDLVPENFIKNEVRMYLIDWEYAGYNDAMWDLAAHLNECEFSKENEELFLSYYFNGQNISILQRQKIMIFKILQDILWSCWTMAKETEGEHFGDYGPMRLKRGIKLAQEYVNLYKKEIALK